MELLRGFLRGVELFTLVIPIPIQYSCDILTSEHFFTWLHFHYLRRSYSVNNCPTRCKNIQFIYICKLLDTFRVVSPPIIRSSYHCIYSLWHYWDRYCYLSSASRWRQVAVTVSVMPDTVNTVIWAPDDGWRYHTKHVEQFSDINKPYIVASCWTIIDTLCDARTIGDKIQFIYCLHLSSILTKTANYRTLIFVTWYTFRVTECEFVCIRLCS